MSVEKTLRLFVNFKDEVLGIAIYEDEIPVRMAVTGSFKEEVNCIVLSHTEVEAFDKVFDEFIKDEYEEVDPTSCEVIKLDPNRN